MKNNNGQTMKNATKKQTKANSNRKLAKKWASLSQWKKYKETAAKHSCILTTMQIEDELFDGILLNLCGRNCVKSKNTQKRILRRIVEKRQAQKAHQQIGRTEDRYASHMLQSCASKSMHDLQRYQICVNTA